MCVSRNTREHLPVIYRFFFAYVLAAILTLASAQERRTSATTPSVSEPSLNEVVSNSCPDGMALLGITVERSSSRQASIKPRCRPIPQGSANAWCNAAPPAGVNCTCDGYEELGWKKIGTGCWACSGTGNRCTVSAQCACVPGDRGAWVPMNCATQGSVSSESNLAGRDATFDACFTVQATGCTYQSVAGATCP